MKSRPDKITLKDIANEAKVSISTVSMALGNYPDVNEETKRKILQFSKKLGYTKPTKMIERRLREGAFSNTAMKRFGYMLIGNKLTDEARSILTHALATSASTMGVRLELSGVDFEEADNLDLVERRLLTFAEGLDGIILSGYLNPHFLIRVQETSVPCVVVNYVLDTLEAPNINIVTANWLGMGLFGTSQLIKWGHRKIGFVTEIMTTRMPAEQWLSGYQLAIVQAGLAFDKKLVHIAGKRFAGGRPAAEQMVAMNEPPTAYVIPDVRTAASFCTAMRDLGTNLSPTCIAMGGELDVTHTYHMEKYPLITIDQDSFAEIIMQKLLDLCKTPARISTTTIIPYTTYNFPPDAVTEVAEGLT